MANSPLHKPMGEEGLTQLIENLRPFAQQEITWAEYQALSEEQKTNGTSYYIKDRSASSAGVDDSMVESLVRDTVGWTGKNLNSYPYYQSSGTDSGITYTVNSDGSVTANGTSTDISRFIFHSRGLTAANSLIVPNGEYILTGCPSTGSSTTYRINANRTSDGSSVVYGSDTGDGLKIVAAGDDYSSDEVHLGIYIYVNAGVTLDNVVFRLMLRRADIADDTYEPYHPTVESELTDIQKSIVHPNEVAETYETSNIAANAYSSGSFVHYIDVSGVPRLAVASKAIAVGDTISNGVNVTNTSITSQLNQLSGVKSSVIADTTSSKLVLVPEQSYITLGTSTNSEDFGKAYIQYLADTYDTSELPIFLGKIHPNGYGVIIGFAYPNRFFEYAAFLCLMFNKLTYRFGYCNSQWYYHAIEEY